MNWQKCAKFHAKRLDRSENIPKRFGATFFLKHPVYMSVFKHEYPYLDKQDGPTFLSLSLHTTRFVNTADDEC